MSPQAFNQPDGIETAAIDNLTNLVALADPALTHSEVFIAGTEPFPRVEEVSAGIAMGPQSQPEITPGRKGSPQRAGEIVLISDPQGHKGYINSGAHLSTSPSPGSPPLAPTQPSAP